MEFLVKVDCNGVSVLQLSLRRRRSAPQGLQNPDSEKKNSSGSISYCQQNQFSFQLCSLPSRLEVTTGFLTQLELAFPVSS